MVSTKMSKSMRRSKEASCLKCTRLHTICHPSVMEAILSETEVVCDLAKYGCKKYSGPGAEGLQGLMGRVYNGLLDGKTYTILQLSKKLKMDRQTVSTTISRLRKKGIEISKETRDVTGFYTLVL